MNDNKAHNSESPMKKNIIARAKKIKLVLLDVDGTLTDGMVYLLPDGEEVKNYSVRDGLGILLGKLAGLEFGIITGKISKPLEKRAARLKIKEVHQGILDKVKVFEDIISRFRITADQVAFIGDDLGDLALMDRVGLAGAVADAHNEIRHKAHFVCCQPGGRGAVREFIEFILQAQGKWDRVKLRAHEVKKFNP